MTWLNAKDFSAEGGSASGGEKAKKSLSILKNFDGVLIPGGFGSTGISGKMKVIKYVRTNKIPYFGLCYGMQLAIIEYARSVLKWRDASSKEMQSKSKHMVIDVMSDQIEKLRENRYGGTMRLGAYPCKLEKGTIAAAAYGGKNKISERHRHRYEVNTEHISALEEAGLVFSGKSPDGKLMEIMELPKKVHPFFVGVQFHPEFLAHPLSPHPLFTEFIKAAKNLKRAEKVISKKVTKKISKKTQKTKVSKKKVRPKTKSRIKPRTKSKTKYTK